MQSTIDSTPSESVYSKLKKRVAAFSTPQNTHEDIPVEEIRKDTKDTNENITTEDLPSHISNPDISTCELRKANSVGSHDSSLHSEELFGATWGHPLGITDTGTHLMDIITSLEEGNFSQPETNVLRPRGDDYAVSGKLSSGAVYFLSHSPSRADIRVDNPNSIYPQLHRLLPTVEKRKKTADF